MSHLNITRVFIKGSIWVTKKYCAGEAQKSNESIFRISSKYISNDLQNTCQNMLKTYSYGSSEFFSKSSKLLPKTSKNPYSSSPNFHISLKTRIYPQKNRIILHTLNTSKTSLRWCIRETRQLRRRLGMAVAENTTTASILTKIGKMQSAGCRLCRIARKARGESTDGLAAETHGHINSAGCEGITTKITAAHHSIWRHLYDSMHAAHSQKASSS